MGNKTPVAQKIDHPRLGPISVVTKDGKRFMQYTVSVHNDQAQKQWEEVIKSVHRKKEYEMVFLPESFEVERVPCGISRNLKALYPLFPFSLTYEISTRVVQKVPFEEKELQYLLFSMVDLAGEFEKSNRKAGNFKPDNALINEQGDLSFICRHSFPGFVDGYTAALYDKQSSYLSPEEMSHLATSDESPLLNPNRCESFSIGMTVLAAGLLENLEPVYNFKQGKFNVAQLQDYLDSWRRNTKYSGFLKDLVERLLKIEPTQRLTPGEMRAYLNPYEESIRVLEKYEPVLEKSEKALYQYRERRKKDQDPKGIRQLGARLSRNTRDSNLTQKTAPKSIQNHLNDLNVIDTAKTTRDSNYVAQTYHIMPQFKPAAHIQPASSIAFTYNCPAVNPMYVVQPPPPMVVTHYPLTHPTAPHFPQIESADKVPSSKTFTPNSPKSKEISPRVPNLKEMVNEFKLGLTGSGGKELKTEYQDDEGKESAEANQVDK